MAAPVPAFATGAGRPIASAAAAATDAPTPCTRLTDTMDQLCFVEPAMSPLSLAGWHLAAGCQPPVPPPATPPLLPAQLPAPEVARCAASCQSPGAAVLPRELLAAIFELVLADDAANDRRPLVQFVSTAWLAAYRCVAHRHVSVHVATALRKLQKRCKLSEQQAEAALLRGLAARLPLAAEVTLVGVPPPHMVREEGGGSGSGGGGRRGGSSAALHQQLHWRLGELLAVALGGSGSLRQLTLDWLPHLPLLLAARGGAQLGLDRLSVTGISSSDLLAHLPALRQQPLQLLGISDAACLPDQDSLLLAAALGGLNHLTCLSLGGNAPSSSGGSGGGDGKGGAAGLLPPLIPAAAFGRHDHNGGAAAAGVAAGWPPAQQPQAAAAAPPAAAPHLPCASLPSLQLVAAAAALPGLLQLELSLTFGKQPSQAQQDYLVQLGLVLHQQRRLREDAAAAAASCRCLAAPACSCACGVRAQGSRVSVVVHEGVQGDLSAVPVASCSLNLDWDDDSNPIEVWQCSTLRRLRIAAQLPLQAGQFRPARLAALQELEVAGCCHMPAYFAEALTSMQQLSRLAFSDCQPEALAAIPWQHVLPRLPQLAEMALERCAGVVMLPTLWLGLACCTQLHSLSITGNACGGFAPWSAAPPPFVTFAGADPPGMGAWQQYGGVPAAVPQQLTAAAAAYASSPIPDCVALMRQLRRLDLSHNGLHALPAALGWCQQLSSVRLSGNQLQSVPLCVQALAGLRKLDLSANQLLCVEEGPYLHSLEHLLLGGNLLLLPSQLAPSLQSRARLRRLSLPLWWQQLGVGHVGEALLAAMPWLQLEAS